MQKGEKEMEKEQFEMSKETEQLGMKLIRELLELGFDEDEISDILTANVKCVAYDKLIEKRIEKKDKQ